MGRKRTTRNGEKLPPHVYRKPRLNAIEYRQYIGKGKFNPPLYLKDAQGNQLKANAALSEVVKAYHRANTSEDVGGRSLRWLLNKYFKSPLFLDLSPRTQKDYNFYADKICEMPGKAGATFGEVPYKKITRKTISAFRDKLSDKKTQANRRLQFLSSVFSWAIEEELADLNPVKGVRKFTLKARTRYAEDNEYNIVLECAEPYDFLPIMMEIAYLCRMRMSEIRTMPPECVTDLGVKVKRSKKSESELTTWTPRLRKAIEKAQALNANAQSRYLIHNVDGSIITENQFRNAWRRTMDNAQKRGLKEKFTFHDIKARGVTNHPTQHSGHKSEKMKAVYVRKAPSIVATE